MSRVPRSRRDLMRASAVLAAASTFSLGTSGAISSVAAQTPGQTGDVETGVELLIPFNPYGQQVSIDPHRTVNWGPFWVMLPYAWSGLLRFDENGAVERDLAETITPNEDGTVWTATLKEGIAFASGNPIRAEHFVASWQRALDHTQLSPMSQFMEPLIGYHQVLAAASTDPGLRAIDERTVELTLSRPMADFPAYLATFVWAVLDPDVLAADGDQDPLLSGAGAGPWKITEFDPVGRIIMEPNEHYWAPPSPSVSRLVWQVITGTDADAQSLALYQEQDAIVADVPLPLMETVQADQALASEQVAIDTPSSTTAILLDFAQEPFNDVRIRQALAAAIDRDTWANETWQGSYLPATSFSPPVLATIANYEAPEGIGYDPDRVAQLLSDADFDPASGTPITYYQPATDSPEDQERHRLLLEAITAATGIEIEHDTSLTADQISAVYQDNGGHQFDIVQWWLVTQTPALLATVASQNSPYNAGWINWSTSLAAEGDLDPGTDAATFDQKVTEAAAQLDEATRNGLYQEAETLLLQNAVYIPLGHWVQRFLRKPWLEGARMGPWSGSIPVRVDEAVVVRNRG
jgi:ABC-type transport system substrate-binding protein